GEGRGRVWPPGARRGSAPDAAGLVPPTPGEPPPARVPPAGAPPPLDAVALAVGRRGPAARGRPSGPAPPSLPGLPRRGARRDAPSGSLPGRRDARLGTRPPRSRTR